LDYWLKKVTLNDEFIWKEDSSVPNFLLAGACDSYVSCVHCVACVACPAKLTLTFNSLNIVLILRSRRQA